MKVQHILLIASRYSYRIAAYMQAAEALSCRVTLASDGEFSIVPALQQGLHIRLDDVVGSIARLLAVADVDAILACDDSTVALAAETAEKRGLPYHAPEAARFSRRKDMGRLRLQQAGIATPWFQRIALQDSHHWADQLPYPVVLKPLSLAASQGVMRANNAEEFCHFCQRLRPIVERHCPTGGKDILIESFVGGAEYAFEGIVQRGHLHQIAIFDKPEGLQGPFFEESYYLTPSALSKDRQQRVRKLLEEACVAYGLHHGPIHAEFRIDGDDIWILEIAARTIGGECALLLQRWTGISLEKMVLCNALGRELPALQSKGSVGVLMLPIPQAGVLRRFEGVLAAQKIAAIQEIRLALRPGEEVLPLPEGDRYLGFVFAGARTADETYSALRQAQALITAVVVPCWTLRPVSHA